MITERHVGFVLGSTQMRSTRHIVTLFTEQGGKRRGVYSLGRGDSRAYIAPLTCLAFSLRGKEFADLATISQVSLEYHLYEAGGDYLGLCLLEHWSFLVDKSQAEHHVDGRVFRLLDHCLRFLRAAPRQSYLRCNLYFEVWLLHFAGMLPRTGIERGFFSVSEERRPATAAAPGALHGLDAAVLRPIFQQKIEEYCQDDLKLGSLAAATEALGRLWEAFLARELTTRRLLLRRFEERGYV